VREQWGGEGTGHARSGLRKKVERKKKKKGNTKGERKEKRKAQVRVRKHGGLVKAFVGGEKGQGVPQKKGEERKVRFRKSGRYSKKGSRERKMKKERRGQKRERWSYTGGQGARKGQKNTQWVTGWDTSKKTKADLLQKKTGGNIENEGGRGGTQRKEE